MTTIEALRYLASFGDSDLTLMRFHDDQEKLIEVVILARGGYARLFAELHEFMIECGKPVLSLDMLHSELNGRR